MAPTLSPRETFRATLATLASRTQAKLPTLNGRVEKACKLVLAGDVELHEDGTALVNSLSDPTRAYQLAQGVCQCRDWGQAPEHLCCHRLAVGFLRKVQEVLPTGQPTPPAVPPTLPEAPASVNVRLTIDGRDCQLTLRDTDEARLLVRLQAVLAQYPAPAQPPARQAPQGQLSPQQHNAAAMHRPVSDFCKVHNVQMRWNEGKEGTENRGEGERLIRG